MHISDIALDDYRSYRDAVVSLEPGITVLVGANGQGKTNFVEAIHYLAAFSSHRVSADQALVRFNVEGVGPSGKQRGAVIRVKAKRKGRDRLVDIEIVAGKANRARLNRNPVAPKEVLGLVPSVLFAPEDLSIIRTDPAARRRFMDLFLSQAYPRYAACLADYNKILAQRAATLRQLKYRPAPDPMLDIWNEQLAQAGSQILSYRARLVKELAPLADDAHRMISRSARTLNLRYEPALDLGPEPAPGRHSSKAGEGEANAQGEGEGGQAPPQPDLGNADECRTLFDAALERNAAKEIERGVNLIGPHRDDLGIFLDSMPVKGFASHGETWSAALALRIGQFHLLTQMDDGDTPILILDDVYAELDSTRRQALEEIMGSAEQVFVTAAVKDDIPAGLPAHFFSVTLNEEGNSVIKSMEDAHE